MAIGRTFTLGLMDLTGIEVRVIKSACAISKAQAKNFKVLGQIDGKEVPDIVMANAESPLALAKWKTISEGRAISSIHVVRDVAGISPYALKRPVVSASLLKLPDVVTNDVAPVAVARSATFRALVVDDSPIVRSQMLVLSTSTWWHSPANSFITSRNCGRWPNAW